MMWSVVEGGCFSFRLYMCGDFTHVGEFVLRMLDGVIGI